MEGMRAIRDRQEAFVPVHLSFDEAANLEYVNVQEQEEVPGQFG